MVGFGAGRRLQDSIAGGVARLLASRHAYPRAVADVARGVGASPGGSPGGAGQSARLA